MRLRRVAIFASIAFVTGCGATAAERWAQRLSAYADAVQGAPGRYGEGRTLIIQDRLRDGAELEANAMDTERQVQPQRLAWTVERDEKQLRLFDTYRDGANALANLRKEQ